MEELGRKLPDDYDGWDIFSPLSPSEVETLFKRIKTPGWCRSLEPIPGAKEAIAEISTFCDVYAVTAQFDSETWVHERSAWLKEHFNISFDKAIFTQAKYAVAGDVFLDDKPINVSKWVEYHPDGLGLLWHMPNTRNMTGGVRVHDWASVITHLREMADRHENEP